MDVLHHLGQLAAILLLIELFVVLLVFLAIAGGLAFGLHWVRGKSGWAFDQAEGGLKQGHHYVAIGLDYIVKPFIVSTVWLETVKATAESVRREVQAQQAAAAPAEIPPPVVPVTVSTPLPAEPAAIPVPPAPAAEVPAGKSD